MNLTITNLPDSSYPDSERYSHAFKSVYNNLQSLYLVLKKYEGVYFDTVTYEPHYQDEYAYKKVTGSYTPVHDDEETFWRKYLASNEGAASRYPNIQNSSNNLTVVDDSTTPSSSQIRISDVTPCYEEINVGDKVERLTRRLVRNCADMDDGGNYHIKCKSGGLVLVFYQYKQTWSTSNNYEEYFEPTGTSNPKRGVVYDIYNEYIKSVNFCCNKATSSATAPQQGRVYAVAELDNAVAISFSDINTTSTSSGTINIGSFDLVITKSEKGKTVILSPRYIMVTRETSVSGNSGINTDSNLRLTSTIDMTVYPNFFSTNAYTYDKCQFNELTILMNIPCCGVTDDYVKNVFVVPFTQYKFSTRRSNAIIKIGDTEYFYTGYLAIKG